MFFSLASHSRRVLSVASIFLGMVTAAASAATVHGVVTDQTGAKVTGAVVVLVSEGKEVTRAVSLADGSFQLMTGNAGRFYLVTSAESFRQLETPGFYANSFDSVERNIVLEPAWVRQSIVVTATGTPTPQAQTGASTTVLGTLDLEQAQDLTSPLRQVPGAFVMQSGQNGANVSLFLRGGNSTANKILVDGVDAGQIGGYFDFGPLTTSSVERVEVYRGPDSNLYGANAAAGVVSVTTPHGTTPFPSILFRGDAGSFHSSHEELTVAGARKKLDYLGSFAWYQTSNDLPRDEYHVASSTANIGYALSAKTQLRATAHYGVDAAGLPNTYEFYQIADDGTERDQNLYLSGSVDNQTTDSLHNTLRYGATRKREQMNVWTNQGMDLDGKGTVWDASCYCTWGKAVSIKGANGYSTPVESVMLDFGPWGDWYANNRDTLVYQGDYKVTNHLAGLVGFNFENERGVYDFPAYLTRHVADRTNYNYLAAVHGDFKGRFYYSLGGSLEHYSLFGTETTPHAGFSLWALRPHKGILSGTRILFNYGDAVREPTLDNEFSSLYKFLADNGNAATAAQMHIGPLAAPRTRTYEGGLEQSFFTQHIIFKASYFHNQFNREMESVSARAIPSLIPNLTAAEETLLAGLIKSQSSLVISSQAYRAQGIESTIESGIGRNIFLRAGYTYLDAVVEHSYTSDNQALAAGTEVKIDGIPVGVYTALKGARPFRRPPHQGYFNASYSNSRITGIFSAAFTSRSDDSTFLSYMSENYDNSMLLPNRNLDHGYAKLDLGGNYRLRNWLSVYAQTENLLNQRHIAPIGYLSLPVGARAGLKLEWGPGSSK